MVISSKVENIDRKYELQVDGTWRRVDTHRYIWKCHRCVREAKSWFKAPLCEDCYTPIRYAVITGWS